MRVKWGLALAVPMLLTAQAARAAHVSPCRNLAADTLAYMPDHDGRPVLRVVVAGHTLRLLLDSGSEVSVLSADGAARIGAEPKAGGRPITGFGGTAPGQRARFAWLSFGGRMMTNLDWPVLDLQGAGVDGLIGADLLAGHQVQIDYRTHLVTLWHANGCGAVRPDWGGGGLHWHLATLPVVDASLDGQALRALIDTGAAGSSVSQAVAGAVSDTDHRIVTYGASGAPLLWRSHGFTAIVLGDVRFGWPQLRVGDLTNLPASLVVGSDLLAGHVLWLDYSGHAAYLR